VLVPVVTLPKSRGLGDTSAVGGPEMTKVTGAD
jgi:hypothetical protein